MKPYRLGKRLWIFLFTLCAAAGAVMLWNSTRMLYPTPEMESAFLRHYTPERVIASFKSKESFVTSHYTGSSSGREYVTYKAGFASVFVLSSEKWMPLMNALKEDAYQQLMANGAQILAQSGDPRNGFRFDYKAGHVIGSFAILPLQVSATVQRAMPLPTGCIDVMARIEQTEKWFPKNPGITQISFTDSQ